MATNDNTATDCDSLTADLIEWIQAQRKAAEEQEIKVLADTNLLEEGVFDSMKILEFVAFLEGEYNISIGVEHLTPKFFSTPEKVAQQVLNLKGG